MKENVLPVSRSESSGSLNSVYSFSADSASTSPPPTSTSTGSGSGIGAGTVALETSSGFQNLNEKPKLSPKQTKPVSKTDVVKQVLWKLYIIFPFVVISIFSVLIIIEKYGHQFSSNGTNGLYMPDLPSSFASESGNYDHLNVEFYDLNDYKETANGWQRQERVLFCVPLRDASQHLPMFFNHMRNLTYPHNLIDLAFLISDTTDSTIKDLKKFLKEFQTDPNLDNRFGRINIYEKDFGQVVGQTFSDRHGFAAQGPRRKLMAIARNWLLSTALRPDHSWVYWRDIDVETCPGTIIEDLMHHNKDVIVPNVWRPLPDWLDYEQPYDLNSWQESEGGLELADKLDEDAVIVEGYSEYATWRPHLAYLRDPNGDPEVEMELDGIGGVSILAKAGVFKSGAHFPAFSFQKHAETEAFGKLCKYMGYSVIGLPHYTIWHIYEPSSDDLKHMEWMAKEEQTRFEKAKLQKIYDRTWKLAFDDVSKDWDRLKFDVFKNTDLSSFRKVDVDWNEVDEYLQDVNDQTINYEHFINEKEEEVRNYDANDPAKFIYNKYSHKKSEIDLKFKLNEFDRQKNFIATDDVMNYGINKGEELFGSFPINPYLSSNPKSMRFVKFKKNELIKFDEPESVIVSADENSPSEDLLVDESPKDEAQVGLDSHAADSDVAQDEHQVPKEVKAEDQIEPPNAAQQQKSKENIRQDAMALVALKQKAAKEEIESLNKKEKIDSIQQIPQQKIDPISIKNDKEKKAKQEVAEKQQKINALAAIKKKEETDQSVNMNRDSAKYDELLAPELKLAKIQEEVELENSINDEEVLAKVKNFGNDKLKERLEDDGIDASRKPTQKEANEGLENMKKQIKENSENNDIAKKPVGPKPLAQADGKAHAQGGSKAKAKADPNSIQDADEDIIPVAKGLDSLAGEGGLTDDINIGGSKEKLAKVDNVKDEINVPKKDEKEKPILE